MVWNPHSREVDLLEFSMPFLAEVKMSPHKENKAATRHTSQPVAAFILHMSGMDGLNKSGCAVPAALAVVHYKLGELEH